MKHRALLLFAILLTGCGNFMNAALGSIGPRGDPDRFFFAPWKDANRVGRHYCPEREFPAWESFRYRDAREPAPGSELEKALASVGPSMKETFARETARPFYWFFAAPTGGGGAAEAPCQVWMEGESLRVWAVQVPH